MKKENKYMKKILKVSLSIFLLVITNSNCREKPNQKMILFDNSTINGIVTEFKYGAFGYYIETSDHPSKEFEFSYKPDGELPRLSSVMDVGDTLIKNSNQEYFILKNKKGQTYKYQLIRRYFEKE
ncbi:hypothetical protein GYB29_02295 [bacterium]|nr:hypothetical protein [Balneola sp.]MBR9916531.1 hypothetical protein [bacterium]